jgi:hypothetical protein
MLQMPRPRKGSLHIRRPILRNRGQNRAKHQGKHESQTA